MAKRTKLSTTLPREIVFQIAQFVPDEASFFAYIEAFQGTTSGQGPIEALWRLGRFKGRSRLWPVLELHPMRANEWELAIEAIPVYAIVNMHARYELHRLVDLVSPLTNLVVVHRDKPDLRRMPKWFGQLVQLPVHALVYTTVSSPDRMPMVIQQLLIVWPSMTLLRHLELTVGDQASLEAICKCIATSQITELRLEGHKGITRLNRDEAPHIKLEGKVWADLVAWLHSARVVRFDLHAFQIICDDGVSMQTLNSALAASDAMQKLFWSRCAIRSSTPLVLPPRLQELSFMQNSYERVGIEWMWRLLPTLPDLTHVNMVGIPLSPSDVDSLASALPHSTVSCLDLNDCSLGVGGQYDGCIQRLADAVEASASLRTLRLMNNSLGFDGVRAILAAIERRPHATELVVLCRNNCDDRREELQELVNAGMPPNPKVYV